MSISEVRKRIKELQHEGRNGFTIAEVLKDEGVEISAVMIALDQMGYAVSRGVVADGEALEVSAGVTNDRARRALLGATAKLITVTWPRV